ncbi:MAG: GDP-L-fucose synthase [Candidatus Dependentiae bacterium]|nr:GDP-L-fucose synthase [Candidatus Dependentiae bacterium]
MEPSSKIYVAGHRGLVGSALVRALIKDGYTNLLARSSQELDLRDQKAVNDFFEQERPEYVFLAAAKVGGIQANISYPASFIYDNLEIQVNVISAAYKYGVKKLLFLGSSCIYPRLCPQPMNEDYLLSGLLEPTNEYYALAKLAGIKLCEAFNKQHKTQFISCLPTNLFGPNDNFDLETAHALPALIAKMHTAKINNLPEVEVWGTGSALREWLYVDDLAQACLLLMKEYTGNSPVNIGLGHDITMRDLAYKIKDIVGYQGKLVFNTNKPDGMPQKLLNVNKINALGWSPETHLDDAIRLTYQWYVEHLQ